MRGGGARNDEGMVQELVGWESSLLVHVNAPAQKIRGGSTLLGNFRIQLEGGVSNQTAYLARKSLREVGRWSGMVGG